MKPDIWHDPLFLAGLKRGGAGGSASGDIVTFNAPKAAPLRSLRIGIDPVQDLHGYDSPWPAGGGKNLFNDEDLRAGGGYWWKYTEFTTRQSAIHLIKVSPNTAYTISKRSGALRVAIQAYGNEALSASENPLLVDSGWKTATYTFTTTANTNYLWVTFSSPNYEYDITASDVQACDFQLELGSTATTYSPYSNVCPISGWDEANLWRTGKNLLAPAFSAGTTKTVNDVNYLYNSDGTVTLSGTCSDANAWLDVASYFLLPAGTYTLSGGAANGIYLSLRTNNNIALATSRPEPETFTISEAKTVRVRSCVLANTVVPNNTVLRPMLELSSTPTSYTPYTGTSYPITIPTPPGTVYGGYISVSEDGSAELVVDRANIASYNGETLPGKWVSSMDVYSAGGTPTTGAQVVYELATPLHYPISDITVQTLAGTNVLWADCGDVAVEWAGGKGFGKEAMLAWVMHR